MARLSASMHAHLIELIYDKFLHFYPIPAQFVSSALKQPELEFELMRPAIPRMRPVPRLSGSLGRPPTLEEEELVPSALIKFHAKETDSVVFTGLANHLLEASEPLTAR